jgi:hypothetical protein
MKHPAAIPHRMRFTEASPEARLRAAFSELFLLIHISRNRHRERIMENDMKFLQLILPVEFDEEILKILEDEDEDWDLAYAYRNGYPLN